MTQRYDVMTGRSYVDGKGNTKTAWTRIGTLWPLRDKDGFSLTFDALPIPQINDGKLELRAVCFPPKDEGQQRGQQDREANRRAPDLDGDSIPF